MNWLVNTWYKPHPIRWLLSPLSALYRLIMFLRFQCYQYGLFSRYKAPVPLIIVGNITVGGTGKTPFVIWLAEQLKLAGYHPGIISRGYGGQTQHSAQLVTPDSDPQIMGDEPVLIARHTHCPVMVSPDRKASCTKLLNETNCDIIIADDGLQHYRLQRDIEIVIVDATRQFGNEYCLPAGPLRESRPRLNKVDFIVFNGEKTQQNCMQIKHKAAVNLLDNTKHKSLDEFTDMTVHAVAGIGNPKRFFQQLKESNIELIEHPFADHHAFSKSDLEFGDKQPILMTEKDAVKCQSFQNERIWYIATETVMSEHLFESIQHQLSGIQSDG